MKWVKYEAIGLIGHSANAVVALLIPGRRDSARQIGGAIEINRPQWVSWTLDVQDDGPLGIGRTRRTAMTDPNMGDRTVIVNSVTRDYIPHQSIKVDIAAPIGFDGTMTCEPEALGNNRTRLTTEGRFQYHRWFANLTEPLVTPQAKAKGAAGLAALKRLAEKQESFFPVPAPPAACHLPSSGS